MLSKKVYNKKVYDFAIETYKNLKENTYDNVFVLHTIFEMKKLGLDIKLGNKLFKDYTDIFVNFFGLEYILNRTDDPVVIGSMLYARMDMLKNIEVEDYIKTDINKWLLFVLKRLIQVTKETPEFFKGEATGDEVRSIEIRSNNLSFIPKPKANDEVEQILEISSTGNISFKSYKYDEKNKKLVETRSENLIIIKGLIKDLLDTISGLFSEEYQDADDLIKENVGLWEVKIDTEHTDYFYTGNLGGPLKYRGQNLSEKIRRIIKIKDLLLFDNNKKEDKINRIEVEYKRVTKDLSGEDEDWKHFETLVIDRASESVEHEKRINNEIIVTKKYKVDTIVVNTLNSFDFEKMFTKIEGNPKGTIEDTNDLKTYSATIIFESGKTRKVKGTYDKRSTPEDWHDFIIDIAAIFSYFGSEDLFNNAIYNQTSRHKSDLIYLSVSFGPNTDRTYYYLTDDDNINPGDFVGVDGGGDIVKIVRVEKKEYFNETLVPYPLDRMKTILGKYNGEVGVEEDGPLFELSYLAKKDGEIDNENQDEENKDNENKDKDKDKKKD